eukprot:scaffold18513_cov101-Isochrysis_galbana.AAC.5
MRPGTASGVLLGGISSAPEPRPTLVIGDLVWWLASSGCLIMRQAAIVMAHPSQQAHERTCHMYGHRPTT